MWDKGLLQKIFTHQRRCVDKLQDAWNNSNTDRINPICPEVFLSDHAENAFDMKFATVILCNVTKKKKMVEKNFQNCSYRCDDVTNYVIFFEKLCEKWLKYVFF